MPRGRAREEHQITTMAQKWSRRNSVSYTQQNERPMGFRFLQQLVTQDPTKILITLMGKGGFMSLLNQHQDLSSDFVALIIRALQRSSTSDNSHMVASMIDRVLRCKRFFFSHLLPYLVDLTCQSTIGFHQIESVPELLLFLSTASKISPNVAKQVLHAVLPGFRALVEHLIRRELADEQLLRDTDKVDQYVKNFFEVKQAPKKGENPKEEPAPTDNFRDITVIPSAKDITSKEEVFLRKNVISGAYSDVDHYLDVHFRLLREDYVRPLRLGIGEFLCLKQANAQNFYIKHLRVYTRVTIEEPICISSGLIHKVRFDVHSLGRVNWEVSKRFLPGSLLCFSHDNFNTVLFGSVVRRRHWELEQGTLSVCFEDLDVAIKTPPERIFIMVETSAYFEAYKHNLHALQAIKEDTFPFQQHIVRVEPTPNVAEYLTADTKLNVAPLLKDKEIEECIVSIDSEDSWPPLEECDLDESQYSAIKESLTKDFTIIQGPPGTGKTFIGLKIVEVLIRNIDVWYNGSPILIVCYTNHALDQFLEGVLDITQDIVRVGGRSSNLNLKSYGLLEMKFQQENKKLIPRNIFFGLIDVERDKRGVQWSINKVTSSLRNLTKTLLSYEDLQHVVNEDLLNSLYEPEEDVDIAEWLLEDTKPTEDTDNEEYGTSAQEADDIFLKQINDDENIFDLLFKENDWNSDTESEVSEEDYVDDIYFFSDSYSDHENFYAELNDKWKTENPKRCRSFLTGEHFRNFLANKLAEKTETSEDDADKVEDVWKLTSAQRWDLYRYWLNQFRRQKQDELLTLQEKYKNYLQHERGLREEQDSGLLQKAKIVGMTTTGAAKYQTMVQRIKSPIVIIEEAAEVFEAHIVTSLSPEAKQVILIGDHKQLRPDPNVYELARDYKLDVSLFERLIKNNFQYHQLAEQHRMRPCISKLLVPHIYRKLTNHPCVDRYEHIRGVKQNMFFINHNHYEEGDPENRSRTNIHEAKFLVSLCNHLIVQDYDPSQITILATYSKQVHCIKGMLRRNAVSKVRVTTVDNFQGEENDIILLSCVRSNDEQSIGFLKIPNRVCVALSRAKSGLYCIGNFDLLSEKSSVWKNVVSELKIQKAIGNFLELQCQKHKNKVTPVSSAEDFEKVPGGGCTLPCDVRLACGHKCPRLCHSYDSKHTKVHCYKRCQKKCPKGHQCRLQCCQPCRPCEVHVKKVIPTCQHTILVHCALEPEKYICSKPCEKTLPCGHQCAQKCGEPCSVKCEVEIIITSLCDHMVNIPCHKQEDTQFVLKSCAYPCDKILSNCEHKCSGSCGECSQGRLHVKCNASCGRTLVCGHLCSEPCAMACPPCQKPCENRCKHSKCDRICGAPCEPCIEPCAWRCKHKRCSKLCFEECTRVACNKPCKKQLQCGHKCIGFCGEPCPSKCLQCNPEASTVFLDFENDETTRFVQLEDCKHLIEVTALEKWLQSSTDEDGTLEIKAKTCPECRTVIRKSTRFHSIIMTNLQDMQKVKKVTYGNAKDNKSNLQRLRASLLTTDAPKVLMTSKKILEILLETDLLSQHELRHIENYLEVFSKLGSIEKRLIILHRNQIMIDVESLTFSEVLKGSKLIPEVTAKQIIYLWTTLTNYVANNLTMANLQQLDEISREVHRLSYIIGVLEVLYHKRDKRTEVMTLLTDLINLRPFRAEQEANLKEDLRRLNIRLSNKAQIGLSEEEKLSVLKAMGLNQGHWFKCPEGHVYAIENCGGAVTQGKCSECGSSIGGFRYHLEPGNRLASEMDGAVHSAYPADMEK